MLAARHFERLIAALEVLLCSGFPTQILIASLIGMAGFPPKTAAGALSVPFVFLLTVGDSIALMALIVVLLAARGERPSRVLFGSRPRGREVLLGLLILPLVFLLAFGTLVLVRLVLPSLHNLETNPLEALIQTRREALMFVVVAVLGGGVREEMQRGFILHRFEQHLGGGWLGVVVYSVAFGAGHILQGRDAAVTLVVLGAFWGFIYLRRRTIVPAMVSHAGFNATQIVGYTFAVHT